MRRIVFDIETKNIFDDVGKNDPTLLDISVVGLYDSETDSYHTFMEDEFSNMWPILERADVLIGYNSDHFDTPLLNKYYSGDLAQIPSLDIMKEIQKTLGRRLSLGNVASATLGYGKSGHGLDAYRWWKEGKIDKIKKYCLDDVKVTKELYEHILKNKKIKYRNGPDLHELDIDSSDWEKDDGTAVTHTLGF